jgi:eukaryotic-like serine/threonine-protein kinase
MISAHSAPSLLRPDDARAQGERAASLDRRTPELPPESIRGRVLAQRYLPEELLEQRPFSVRYGAYDLATNATVYVEFLPSSAAGAWPSIRQAVGRLAALGHPHILEIVGRGMLSGVWPFLVSEDLECWTLGELSERAGPLELARVLRVGLQCARALGAAHAAGVVHGAFSPNEVFVREAARADDVVKLRGFGFAELVREWQGSLLGSREFCQYVSPEQIRGREAGARSDVYALGAVLYELSTGAPPFVAETAAAVLDMHLGHPSELPSERRGSRALPWRAFDKIIGRCLAKSPEQRYCSAVDLANDLARLHAAVCRSEAARPEAGRAGQLRPSALQPSVSAHRPPLKSALSLRRLPKVIIS